MAGRKGKSIAKKLELSEVKYRELFDSINVCVIVLKPKDDGEELVIKDINAATEKVERIRLGEFVGKSVVEAMPAVVDSGIFDLCKKVWRTGEPQRFPAREFKDKRIKGWREGYIYRLPSGDIVAVYEDVTARIKAEGALKKAELRYRTVADFTYDLEYWKGPDRKLLYISPSCERITGYSVQEFMNDPGLLDRMVLEEDGEIWASHENSRGSFSMNEILFRIKRRDGEIRWIEHRCRPIIDENNSYLGIRSSNRDITYRKNIEQRLSDSEERFRTLFLMAPVGLVMVDAEGRFIDANKAFQQMLGFTRDELLNKSILDITHPADKDLYLALSGEVVRGERQGYSVEKRYVKKDGTTLWANLSAVKVEAPDGGFLYRIGIIEDITEHKKAAEALKKSEARYRALIETTGAGFLSHDFEGKIMMVNESLCEISGYTRGELIGRHVTDFVHPDDLSFVMNEFSSAVAKGRIPDVFLEMRIMGKNRAIWMRFYPTGWMVDGRTVGVNAAAFDITDRKQAEEALKESEARYRTLIETMGAGFAGVDLEGKIVMVNEALCEISGYTKDEVVGRNFVDFVHPDDLSTATNEFNTAVAQGRTRNIFYELRILGKNNVIIWVRFNPTEWIVNGRSIGMTAAMFDITDLKLAEESLRRSEELFRLLAEKTGDVIWLADPQFKSTYISPSIRKLRGFTPEEAMSQTLADTMTPQSVQIILNKYEQYRADIESGTDETVYVEVEQYRKDGSTIWVETAIRAVYNDAGKLTGFVGVSRDISQRKQAQNPETGKPDRP